MNRVTISGIGIKIPDASITNDELVDSFNTWVDWENARRSRTGEPLLQHSSSEFIVHASGIEERRVISADGILDPERMAPRIPRRSDEDLSVMAEFGVASARQAIEDAGVDPASIDLVICSASHQQRPYPAIGIEIQKELGIPGAAFDMSLGCSSAAAGLHLATNLVRTGAQKRVLVTTPEIISGHLSYRDRQTHFIFGDASASLIVEPLEEGEMRPGRFEVIDTGIWTQFSNNIRSNFGFLNRAMQEDTSIIDMTDNLIKQVGNKVFKEVTVAGHHFIVEFLARHDLTPHGIRRFWLHQANARMNAMILRLALGEDADHDRAPMVLQRLGNTAAAGAIVALKENHEDLKPGDVGLICAFGAGYSIGGALLRMM
ncbi:MAG TPA: beta-ketoacyl-ACP synthase III [Rhizobiaceae bacterium]|nr:beta-ketoacyl-ACP synthase III [Rhizobiaceae bacterium]